MIPEIIDELAIYSIPFISTGVTLFLTLTGFYLHRNYQTNKFTQALIILDQIVIDVVQDLNRTVVADLKAAKADGKLTRDEAEQIKHKAIELIITKMGGDMLKTIQIFMGPIPNILATKIEAAVFDAKRSQKIARKTNRPIRAQYH